MASGGTDRMFGYFAGERLDQTGRAFNARLLSETVINLPSEASALKAAQALRIDANQQTPRAVSCPTTVAELIEHYRLKELTEDDQGRKAHSTRAGYECYLNGWILPRWGNHRMEQVKSVAVEEWLGSIERARGTKAKIRNIMSALFSHAMRYEWSDRNPIKLVRQSAKRERIPDVLELHELQALLAELAVRERTLFCWTRRLACESVNSWPSAGTTLILRTWRFALPSPFGIRYWVSAKQRRRPGPSQWTAIWPRIFCAGEKPAPIRSTVIGSSPVRL